MSNWHLIDIYSIYLYCSIFNLAPFGANMSKTAVPCRLIILADLFPNGWKLVFLSSAGRGTPPKKGAIAMYLIWNNIIHYKWMCVYIYIYVLQTYTCIYINRYLYKKNYTHLHTHMYMYIYINIIPTIGQMHLIRICCVARLGSPEMRNEKYIYV